MIVSYCKYCGSKKEYKYKSVIKKYCSHKCANSASAKIRTKNRIFLKCEYCHNNFALLESVVKAREKRLGHPVKFCSQKCMGLANRKPNTFTLIKCGYCDKEFLKRTDKIWDTNYCSLGCSSNGRKKEYTKWQDRGYMREYLINYRKLNIGKLRPKIRINCANRRAMLRNADGNFTYNEWISLCNKYENKCLCCNEEKLLTIDHIIPLIKGGSNFIHNIQPLCSTCNRKKATKVIDFKEVYSGGMSR